MTINFTGIKNVGSLSSKSTHPLLPIELHVLNVQMTDDYNGKDLSEYRKVLNKTSNNGTSFFNSIAPDFLNIHVLKFEDNTNNVITKYIVNGHVLKISDSNIPIIEFISKITKKISKTNEKDFIINKDYLDSDEFRYGFVPGNDIDISLGSNATSETKEDLRKTIHTPRSVKKCAEKIHNNIHNTMLKYFA